MFMKFFLLVFFQTLAFQSFAMDEADARHLLIRTGFTPTPSELAAVSTMEYRHAVEQLLLGTQANSVIINPEWVGELPPVPAKRKQMSKDERKVWRKKLRRRGFELRGWWIRQMVATRSPLTERMVLFWHNHFTSSLQKVRWPNLIYHQNQLFRRYALGNFRDLLHAVSQDPAMVIYLDSHRNKKGKPKNYISDWEPNARN